MVNSIVQWVSFCFHVRVTPVQILRSVFSFQIAFAVEDAEEKADVDPFDDDVALVCFDALALDAVDGGALKSGCLDAFAVEAVDGTAGASCFDFFCDSVWEVSFLFDMIEFFY